MNSSFGLITFPNVKFKGSQNDKSNENYVPFAYFSKDSKEVEIHLLTGDLTNKSEKEIKKFSRLIKNYLITF